MKKIVVIKDLEVDEVSLVDNPAIGEHFAIFRIKVDDFYKLTRASDWVVNKKIISLKIYKDKTRRWDASRARTRIAKWASKDGSGDKETIDWNKYAKAFLVHRKKGQNFSDYKFPLADIINGELYIIPRAVVAATVRLGVTTLPASIREEMERILEKLRKKIFGKKEVSRLELEDLIMEELKEQEELALEEDLEKMEESHGEQVLDEEQEEVEETVQLRSEESQEEAEEGQQEEFEDKEEFHEEQEEVKEQEEKHLEYVEAEQEEDGSVLDQDFEHILKDFEQRFSMIEKQFEESADLVVQITTKIDELTSKLSEITGVIRKIEEVEKELGSVKESNEELLKRIAKFEEERVVRSERKSPVGSAQEGQEQPQRVNLGGIYSKMNEETRNRLLEALSKSYKNI